MKSHRYGIYSNQFSWCSGYHICLTHRRSPVRNRAKTISFFVINCIQLEWIICNFHDSFYSYSYNYCMMHIFALRRFSINYFWIRTHKIIQILWVQFPINFQCASTFNIFMRVIYYDKILNHKFPFFLEWPVITIIARVTNYSMRLYHYV